MVHNKYMVRSKKDTIISMIIVLPSFTLILIFVYGFILWTLRTSLSNWDGIVPDYTFAGFRHYVSLFLSARFQKDLWNTFFFTALFLASTICTGMVLALLIDNIARGENVFRNIFLFPMSISFVITGIVWGWIFNPSIGINALLRAIGLSQFTWGWYTDTTRIITFNVALIPVIIAATWQLSGYTMAMFLAGLRSIPPEIFESGVMDGATHMQIIRAIVIPLLKPILLSAMIVLGHISLKIFDLVYTMTGKGPAFVTDFPGIFMFETTFQGNHYAEGAGISMIMLIMIALVIIPYLYTTLRKQE
jgi:glucose/mannose transport system permease protein